MRVEVIKAYGYHSIGAVIPEMPANVARTLIARGLVRELVGDRKDIAVAPANRMMARAPGRKAAS